MNGVVLGGWEYVWAAYGVTAVAFLIYGVTLVTRFRDAKARVPQEGESK